MKTVTDLYKLHYICWRTKKYFKIANAIPATRENLFILNVYLRHFERVEKLMDKIIDRK